MSEIAARHLMAKGAGPIFVANRTYERAQILARRFGGSAIRFDELYDHCEQSDIVITSTGAPVAIFRREHGERFLNRRRNRPMFFIDIAVPRDVDPEMNKLAGIFVYDIDDLQEAAASHAAARSKEAERAETIIEDEVGRFQARVQSLHVVPAIVSLQDYVETIRQAELDRVRGRLGHLSLEQEQALEALTRGIVNKILHTPITRLKSAAAGPEVTTLIEAFKKIFNLQDKAKATEEKQAAKAEPGSETRSR
jgi:glutamyl-tRNA reductase